MSQIKDLTEEEDQVLEYIEKDWRRDYKESHLENQVDQIELTRNGLSGWQMRVDNGYWNYTE